MRDAAFPAGLRGWAGAVGGYLNAPRAFNPWTAAEWAWFLGNRKLPIWVGGLAGEDDAFACLRQLFDLAVPVGAYVAADMETRVDETYLTRFGAVLHWFGYRVLVYGSTGTLFENPPLDGYWVADPTGQPHLYAHADVPATQYLDAGAYDASLVDAAVADQFWR